MSQRPVLHRLAWLAALLQNVMDTGGCEALALPAALLSRSGGGLFLPASFLSPFPASNIHALFHKTLPWQSAKRNKSDTEPNPEQSAAWPCRAYPSTPPEGKHRCSSPGGPRARGRRERKHGESQKRCEAAGPSRALPPRDRRRARGSVQKAHGWGQV